MRDDVITCAYVTRPFDNLRVTGYGELSNQDILSAMIVMRNYL
jgi:hypothetical protein